MKQVSLLKRILSVLNSEHGVTSSAMAKHLDAKPKRVNRELTFLSEKGLAKEDSCGWKLVGKN